MTEDYEKLGENNSPEHSGDKVKKKRKKKVPKDDSLVVEYEMSPAEVTDELISPRADKPKKKKKKPPQVTEEQAENESQVEPIPIKKKKKKKVTMDESLGLENEMSPAEATDEIISPRGPRADKPKKKKKKKPQGEETVENQVEEVNDTGISETVEGETEQPVTETPKKMKRRKKKPKEETEKVTQPEEELSPREIEDEGKILAVVIHRTDNLKNNFYIQHPLVRVHIVDQITGYYLEKQHPDRAVTSYYETSTDHVEKILPIMTQPFVFRQEKSTLPVWEELLIFNENFNYFIQERPQVIVFFELIDFVSMNMASRQYEEKKSSGGWHRIAWAFLKIYGGNKELNVGKKVRLQLFEPPNNYRLKTSQVEIFQWWQNTVREPYPSTLYVTLKGVNSPNMVEPSTRSMFATQEELGKMTYEELQRSMNFTSTKTHEVRKRHISSWNRLYGQTCRIPNDHMMSLKAGRKGCFVLKFSRDGRSLACACRDNETYPIIIYDIPSGKLLGELTGHFGIVYDLCWSRCDDQILSASNDGTARLWNAKKYLEEQSLPHPTFVYTAQFHPKSDFIVVTGAFDQVIRVWDIEGENVDNYLRQEIEDHQGHVNSVCFDEEGEKLYSADSKGIIMVWNTYVTEQKSRHAFITDWSKYQEIKEPSIKDTPINFLKMHPSGRKLLVHCRDNIIRLFDLRVQRVIQNYIGSLNFREKLLSTISPCGTFVFAGSEDNIAYVWNTDSGDQVAKYSELNYNQPVTDVEYHPRDHIIAFCSIGENQPIQVYKYNPNTAFLEAGIYPSAAEESDNHDDTLVATARTMESPRKLDEALSPEPTSARVLTRDQFEAHETNRLQNVLKKLETVTLGGDPTLFSPHAPLTMSSVMQQQTFNSQSLYMKDANSSWRPGFSDVGRKSGASHIYQGRLPQFSLTQTQGKAQFSFQPPLGRSPPQKMVVAICDYKGQRSDELSLFKGDVIKLLYKDSGKWWMGELANGQQGYFPANYVAVDGAEDEEEEEEGSQVVRKKERKKKVVHMK